MQSIFNVGPFTTDGGNEVINNQIFQLNNSGMYRIVAGPSTRRVIDFSDIENSVSILPTGQSGNIFSDHYDDQAQKFINGEFVRMELNQNEIEKSENVLIFNLYSKNYFFTPFLKRTINHAQRVTLELFSHTIVCDLTTETVLPICSVSSFTN